ncbi:expressed unknown protein [Seminavis robusta]|uniref:Methyltransferase domain-containing protein n=1 Tax=Seminavis robusta TaxID=568900 RepID=A0A9N8EQ73_9STRA|nr:expressed unknown protein [Seminavis robusta]|eukprot:Sro1422_g271320.1 n/a (249) ;mRNA; f:15479-16225
MGNVKSTAENAANETVISRRMPNPKLVDRVLAPIRQQIQDLVVSTGKSSKGGPKMMRVLDVACGTGDQLFRLRRDNQIDYGLGIDLNPESIQYARERAQAAGLVLYNDDNDNHDCLEYRIQDLQDLQQQQQTETDNQFDIAMATLFFHVVPWPTAVSLLMTMSSMAPKLIVAAFVPGEKWQDKLLLWLDQRFTSHYAAFCHYLEKGSFEGLLQECDNCLEVEQVLLTNDATIRIYVLRSKAFVNGQGN